MAAWPPHSMEDVEDYVEWQGGIAQMQMRHLRDAAGCHSLKVHELAYVKGRMANHGLASLVSPKGDQNQTVWLYKRDTPLGQFLDAAKGLTEEDIEALRNAPSRLPRIKLLRTLFDREDR